MIFASSDLHLSWNAHGNASSSRWSSAQLAHLKHSWSSQVSPWDTVLLCGDLVEERCLQKWISALYDFCEDLPGEIYCLKGNHDSAWRIRDLGKFYCRSAEGAWEKYSKAHKHLSLSDTLLVNLEKENPPRYLNKDIWRASQSKLVSLINSYYRKGRENIVFASHKPSIKTYWDPFKEVKYGRGNKHRPGSPVSGTIQPTVTTVFGHLHGETAKSYMRFASKITTVNSVVLVSPDVNAFSVVPILEET